METYQLVVWACSREDGGIDLIISKHYVFLDKEVVQLGGNLRSFSPAIVLSVGFIVGVGIYQIIIVNEPLENLVFHPACLVMR